MIALGAVELPDDMVLDPYGAPPVAASVRHTLGGGCVVQTASVTAGLTLTLASVTDTAGISGAVPRATVDALRALQTAGLPVTLTHPEGDRLVFLSALATEQILPLADPGLEDLYLVTITLITV